MNPEWVRESNLIENVDDPTADRYAGVAWRFLLGEDLTIDSMRLAHLIICWPVMPEIGGRIRTCEVRVGRYIAPPSRKVPSLMIDWMSTYKHASTEQAIQAAHVAFECIHPFVDGNGRIGRIVMNWQRMKAGMEPLCILAHERQNYYQWFESPR